MRLPPYYATILLPTAYCVHVSRFTFHVSRFTPPVVHRPQEPPTPKIAVLTISDGVTAGTREDTSGRLAVEMLEEALQPELVEAVFVPDDRERIEETLVRWSDQDRFDLIITSGGTGISPRDNTPQATLAVLDYEVPGLAEMMRITSLQMTPMAALSRAVAGVRGRTLIINLPGSPKGVRECLDAVLPILPHALEQLASGAGH